LDIFIHTAVKRELTKAFYRSSRDLEVKSWLWELKRTVLKKRTIRVMRNKNVTNVYF